ncbi:MAG: CDP-alcohol phosphatidyltransferase family protein [Rhodospirillales bacterium]
MVDRRRRLKALHINRMIPNMLTLLALAAGLSAVRFSLQERWEHAVLAIAAAAILDALDGRIARILKGTTKFGAELDSLSDFVCFGVAPAMILYLWALTDAGRFGWSLVLVFCICCALRLARFNTAGSDEDTAPWTRNFFVGVPSPAGAGMALLPIGLWFQSDAEVFRHPATVAFFMLATAALLVSRIPTYSFKKIGILQSWILPTMAAIGFYLAFLVSAPWVTLSLSIAAYVASIPFSIRTYRRLVERDASATAADGVEPTRGP